MDSATSYAKGDIPEMVIVLDKDEMDKYNESSKIQKVRLIPEKGDFFKLCQ
jgi:hypothetical protein